jgi:glycosyltransferase involved in cell wall biosynthesis
MSVQPRITFAIPYYRGLEYLEKALRSLQEQSNPNWVAIVVDDRGGDGGKLRRSAHLVHQE